MRRSDFLLELIRTRNAAALAALVVLVIVGRFLGNRRSTWIVVLLGLLAVTLGYVLKLPPGSYGRPRVSPDGTQVALQSEDASGESIVWIYDLSGRTSIRQLTFEGRNRYPVWSPDGR